GWKDGVSTFERKIVLGTKKENKTGSRFPAGLAVSKDGGHLYVAENVADALAAVDLHTGDIQRLATDHYPYAVEVAAGGSVFVSAGGSDTGARFRQKKNGAFFPMGRLGVGQPPSALLTNRAGSRLYVTLSGSDQIAVVDARSFKLMPTLKDPAPAGPS